MPSPKPPTALSARSKRLWRQVLVEYELSSAEVELFRTALVALDEEDGAAETLRREGSIVNDRYGVPKQHPAIDIRNRARLYFARTVAQLGIRATPESIRNQAIRGSKTGPKPRSAHPRRAS